ncbi:hypothetical protein FK220_010060 [Flavobacteriaceae bacterium TP-CH-4]|uniref:Uncharacterized protein n=1 Tax=Pelagihabitans pacificus TaxID=2696054 RepID=A0A967EAR7_9FLAO|nr:DUF6090 family protein [Pelagihabitans pacificus]NHF59686.1 hypothetical protein [Pelagihabitans pacificus]
MIKFFREIRKTLVGANTIAFPLGKFGRYLIYAFGEIVLLVIGILIALYINNQNNEKIAREDEKKSYLNIKQQITDDKNELVKVKKFNNYHSVLYKNASKIITAQDRTKTDSLALFAMALSQYSDFHRSGTIYETLVNSGELTLLKNSDIVSAVQRLEMTYTFANKLEDIHWELIINELSPELRGVIDYAKLKTVQPDKLFSVELHNIFYEIINLSKLKDTIYGTALNDIDVLVDLIDDELGLRMEH